MDPDSQREENIRAASTRWEFITLADFKSSSPLTVFAYVWLWIMAVVAVAVYAVDTFTAVNLLVFNNWSSQVQPYLAFKYSKWIFSVCIIVSWALCFYEWVRALRAIRRGGVADSYMDPLAVTLQSMRSSGWRRFLVFGELSKSKKRVDYVALFVYFAFKGALRIILAEGPRQVINALTLYSVMVAKLIGAGSSGHHSNFVQFFLNIKALAEQNDRQAIILFSMLFTLVIWVFSALSLMVAIILYVVFLWHHIPRTDGSLSAYCRRKIDKRLDRIVEHKVQAGIEEERRKREKAEQKAELKRQKTGELAPPAPPRIMRQPTLPQLDTFTDEDVEKAMPGKLERQNTTSTVSTLPPYSSRSPQSSTLQRQPTLPNISEDSTRPAVPYRSFTQGSEWSNVSYNSDAPLLPNAGQVDGNMAFPPPAFSSRQGSTSSSNRPFPTRQGTMNSVATDRPYRSQTPWTDPHTLVASPAEIRASEQERAGSRTPFGQRYETEPADMTSLESAEPLPPFRMPFASHSANPSVEFGHERMDSQSSNFSRPMVNPGPMVYSASNMGRHASHQSTRGQSGSFSRPFGRSTTAPPSASGFGYRPNNEDAHTPQASFSGQVPSRKPTPASANLYRPFSPAAASLPLGQAGNAGAYEMTVHPSAASTAAIQTFEPPQSSSAVYVAFNPRAATPSSAAPMNPRSVSTHSHRDHSPPIAHSSSGGIGQDGSYFSGAHDAESDWYGAPPSIPAASHDHRLTTGYNDILDDYGGSTPGE